MPQLMFAAKCSRAPRTLPRWCARTISLGDLHCRDIGALDDRAAEALIVDCCRKAERLLAALQTFRSFSRWRRKELVRIALNTRPLHVWCLYRTLRQMGLSGRSEWTPVQIVQRALEIDLWSPLEGDVLQSFQGRRDGEGRPIYRLAHPIDAARHALAVAVLRAVEPSHPHMFSAHGQGGEAALKAIIRERWPDASAVLTTDLPSCFASLKLARVEERLLLPKQVTRALLTQIKPRRGAGPRRRPRSHSQGWSGWRSSSSWYLRRSGSCADALDGEFGVLAGLPLAALAAETVLSPVLASIEGASPSVTAGFWVDNLIVILPREADEAPVLAALAAALRDAVCEPARIETHRRIERRPHRATFKYLKYQIEFRNGVVVFGPEDKFFEGLEQRLQERGGAHEGRATAVSLKQSIVAAVQRYDPATTIARALDLFDSVRDVAVASDAPGNCHKQKADFSLHTDGACAGAPGPGGWAAVLSPAGSGLNTPRPVCFSGHRSLTTSNVMELTAVIEGLRQLPDGESVTVFSDSRYVVDTATERLALWRKAGGYRPSGRRPSNWNTWTELATQIDRLEVEFRWIKGHAGDPLNSLADRLARKAMTIGIRANLAAISSNTAPAF